MDSPKRLARIAGVLYLLVAIFGGLAYFVDRKVYVSGSQRIRPFVTAGLVEAASTAELRALRRTPAEGKRNCSDRQGWTTVPR